MTARYSTRRFLVTFFLIAVILGLIGHRPLWGQDAIADFDGAVRAAIESVSPSVVRIETVGGSERVGDFAVGTAATTGLVVSDDGLVLTSAFGFVQEPSSIIVRLDGQPNGAKVVARDHARKLVLLKIERETAGRVPDVVPRSDLRVGQTAIALGKTYSSDTPSVSIGIMSALNRIWGRAVQTDCKVSPANYGGPLIDLHGRVIGLLVPMSPQQQTDLAGLEWYDSGIGFAVPLSEVITVIDRLKAGEDLHPGLLGITLKGRNIYADEAIIATTAPNSPAEKAGLQVGDNIIEVAGQAIARQAELKHVLGTLYAGQSVALTVQRDGQSVAIEVELVQTIEPYEHAFLGVLPLRVEGDAVGVPVRYVYPGSPAEKLGLVRGDRLTHLNGEEVKDSLAWLERLAQHVPGDEVEIKYVRGDQEHVGRVALASLPAETPAESLPPAIDEGEPGKAAVELLEVKVPEQTNRCWALVPDLDALATTPGLVIWLGSPGSIEREAFQQRWESIAADYGLVVLAPIPEDDRRWEPTELEFIQKAVEQVVQQYAIDPQRVVVHGFQAGGAMAYRFAMENRERVRAIVAVDAAYPMGLERRANDPLDRLALYLACGKKSVLAVRVERDAEQFRAMKFPVIVKTWPEESKELNSEELQTLARWIDTLDRI